MLGEDNHVNGKVRVHQATSKASVHVLSAIIAVTNDDDDDDDAYGEIVIFYNSRLTIGVYSNAIQNFYTPLLC